MSSDFLVKVARAAGMAALLVAPVLLSSCQVRPLYAESTGVTPKLASIQFSDTPSRVGLQVRNQLIFIAGRGAGEPAKPEYHVDLSVSSGTQGVIYLASSDTSAAARTTVTVSYVLKRISDGKVIKSGSRNAIALVDQPAQEFTKLRAVRDSEDRAAREAAEFVGADLAAALSR